jgi:hypothetical protein
VSHHVVVQYGRTSYAAERFILSCRCITSKVNQLKSHLCPAVTSLSTCKANPLYNKDQSVIFSFGCRRFPFNHSLATGALSAAESCKPSVTVTTTKYRWHRVIPVPCNNCIASHTSFVNSFILVRVRSNDPIFICTELPGSINHHAQAST